MSKGVKKLATNNPDKYPSCMGKNVIMMKLKKIYY